jgi:hypothetical protein
MFRTAALLASLTLAAPLHAGFLAHNGMIVEQTGPARFDVAWTGGANGAPDFWCAAGDYVVRALNLPSGTEIYRYDPPVRAPGENVSFGLDPSGATRTGLLRLSRDPGVSAAFARTFCPGVGTRDR